MTRKDFVIIAKVLKGLNEDRAHCFDNEQDRKIVARRFAEALSNTNTDFNYARFFEACGVNA
jgi:hypothetical protein